MDIPFHPHTGGPGRAQGASTPGPARSPIGRTCRHRDLWKSRSHTDARDWICGRREAHEQAARRDGRHRPGTRGCQSGALAKTPRWSGADSSKAPNARQRTTEGYPQSRRTWFLRFPHYPQFCEVFGGRGPKGCARDGETSVSRDRRRHPRIPGGGQQPGGLTPQRGRRYNRRAVLPAYPGVSGRRTFDEENLPAQQPQAEENPRLSRADVHPRRPPHPGQKAPQGPLRPERLSTAAAGPAGERA